MKFVRDITKVSKRERMAAGIFSTIVGSGIILLSDWSMGEGLNTSITDIIVTIVAGVVFLGAFRWISKSRAVKA